MLKYIEKIMLTFIFSIYFECKSFCIIKVNNLGYLAKKFDIYFVKNRFT